MEKTSTVLYYNFLPDLKELVFQILKSFFEKTQLVEVMNEIIHRRRGDIFERTQGRTPP